MNDAAADTKYKFGGKEFNEDFGLKLNDYGARWYDAAVGRWAGVDLLSEAYNSLTPYNYTTNNPLRYNDPNGMYSAEDDYRSSKSSKTNPTQAYKDENIAIVQARGGAKATVQSFVSALENAVLASVYTIAQGYIATGTNDNSAIEDIEEMVSGFDTQFEQQNKPCWNCDEAVFPKVTYNLGDYSVSMEQVVLFRKGKNSPLDRITKLGTIEARNTGYGGVSDKNVMFIYGPKGGNSITWRSGGSTTKIANPGLVTLGYASFTSQGASGYNIATNRMAQTVVLNYLSTKSLFKNYMLLIAR
jgi:RHS repeat-associated protein